MRTADLGKSDTRSPALAAWEGNDDDLKDASVWPPAAPEPCRRPIPSHPHQSLPRAPKRLGVALTRPMAPTLVKIMQSMVLEQALEARRINIRP